MHFARDFEQNRTMLCAKKNQAIEDLQKNEIRKVLLTSINGCCHFVLIQLVFADLACGYGLYLLIERNEFLCFSLGKAGSRWI